MDEVLNNAPCGFLSFADDGVVTQANETLLEMLGYGRGELAGRHVEHIFTVGSRIFYQTHWFPLLRLHGRAEEIFLMLRAKGGDEIGALVNAARREREGAVRYDCVVMQVRERKKYEEELLRAKRNAEAARADLEERARALRRANELLEAQAVELELQQQQLQEQAAELELTSEELRVANEDLLERTEEAERLRAEAEEANQAKSRFLASMSHELRTPLNAIAGYVQILEMEVHGPVNDAQRDDLDRIGRSQHHLLRLINDILNLSRVEAGRVEYEIEEADPAEVTAMVLPMIEPQMRKKGLALEVAIEPGQRVRADLEKMQQILLNLLSNAVKFTPDGGRVRIDAVPSPEASDRLLVRVTDSGIGIPAEKLSSIFDPFVQAGVTSEERSGGSGLGLAISRDLARGMGGDLSATSIPGEGSCFTLSLPRGAGNPDR